MEIKFELKAPTHAVFDLGGHLYGQVIPSIAEFIANAYDAEANVVDITIERDPRGKVIKTIIKDDGHGMTTDECQEDFLYVGKRRRRSKGMMSKNNKRRVMGRKGIGKLAGFGIAEVMKIESFIEGKKTTFVMKTAEILDKRDTTYKFTGTVDDCDANRHGTIVTLDDMKELDRQWSDEYFRQRMAARFLAPGDDFIILVNSEQLRFDELDWFIRIPEEKGTWLTETLDHLGEVKYWIGFLNSDIPKPLEAGLTIYATERLVQEPWFFDITRYYAENRCIGQFICNGVDEGIDESTDMISSSRKTLMWENNSKLDPLYKFGQKTFESAVRDYDTKRQKAARKQIDRSPILKKRFDNLSPPAKKMYENFENTVTKTELSEDKVEKVLSSVIYGVENYKIQELISIVQNDPAAVDSLLEIFQSWKIAQAFAILDIVRMRLDTVTQLENMIFHGQANELDYQKLLEDHPWIINPGWLIPSANESIKKLAISRGFEKAILEKDKLGNWKQRPDFICVSHAGTIHVVEIKKPGRPNIPSDEARKILEYVVLVEELASEDGFTQEGNFSEIKGWFVCDKIREMDERVLQNGNISIIKWDRIADRAKLAVKEFQDEIDKYESNVETAEEET